MTVRSRSGEIGIRTRLKIWRGHTHVGSSPTSGTNLLRILEKRHFPTDLVQRASKRFTASAVFKHVTIFRKRAERLPRGRDQINLGGKTNGCYA